MTKRRSTHTPPTDLPTVGGSYRRTKDGALVKNAKPKPEPSAAETPASSTQPAADAPRGKSK